MEFNLHQFVVVTSSAFTFTSVTLMNLKKIPGIPGEKCRDIRRMAENGFAPPPREFCRHILSCRELKAESFKRCLHSVLRGVSL